MTKDQDTYLYVLHTLEPQCGQQEQRTEPGQEQRPELGHTERDDGVEENHDHSRGPQHTPAGPHPVGHENPGSVLQTESGPWGRGEMGKSKR